MENNKFFFSYSRQNTDFVKQLASDLKAAGASVWLDQLDIPVGEHWDEAIQQALNEATGVLVVLSPASVQSDNVLDEASYALDRGKRIIPLMIESCEVPLRLARKQFVDFTADYHAGFQNLLKALAETGAAPETARKGSAPGNGSTENRAGSKTSFWSLPSAKLGAVSALLGIVLSGAAAFKLFSSDNTKKAANREALLRIKDLEPKVEASYVSMADNLYYHGGDSTKEKPALFFLDYPLLKNEIADETEEGFIRTPDLFDDTSLARVHYLILQNIGKATPTNLQVVLKRYVLRDKVTIEEIPGTETADYTTLMRAKTTDSSVRTFRPPVLLETGKGIRVPLFISGHSYGSTTQGKMVWSVLSKIAYIPEKVLYTDPLDEKQKEVRIRSMKDPVRLAPGVEGRG